MAYTTRAHIHTHTHTHTVPLQRRDWGQTTRPLRKVFYLKASIPLRSIVSFLLTTLSFLLSLYFTTVGSVFYLNAGFLCALSLRVCMCWCARALRKHMVSYYLRSNVMGGGGIALIVTSLVCCWCARALHPSQSALLHQLLLKY